MFESLIKSPVRTVGCFALASLTAGAGLFSVVKGLNDIDEQLADSELNGAWRTVAIAALACPVGAAALVWFCLVKSCIVSACDKDDAPEQRHIQEATYNV